ncbi:MAG TPA: sigma-54 dependent transcriptional regulator [Vicinamibacteria bacterium]|nr:sigma-54 dependent transcriptional regulator [Vicinamibacteria bacterium]
MSKPRILIVDDDPGTLESLSRAFALEGLTTLAASSAARALELLAAQRVDAVLTDVVMPEMDGLSFLERLREKDADVPVVVMSGQATLDMAIKATRLGALDFVEKPVGLERLLVTLRNALRLDRLERENRDLRGGEAGALLGTSAAMEKLRALVERAAPTDAAILVLGENGSGKELVARAIHAGSPRRDGPFVPMNCAAVPAELVESELFGHEKGSFTGASAQRRGLFEQADGGTLFLDEIADMPASMQAKLLRVLQDGNFTRVGGHATLHADVRLISATNRDVDALVADGRFREDLLYRINTLTIRTPPLREHREDVPALVAHLAEAAARRNRWRPRRFSDDALALLRQQPWRGNVRELRNVVERVLILSEGDEIGAEDVRAALPAPARSSAGAIPAEGALRDVVDAFEREVIRERLKLHGGHVTNAAKSLDLERSHLYKKCRQLGIDIREES